MSFIHEPYQSGETITAICTPLGEGGVAIIRISGDDALSVSDRIFSGSVVSYATHTAHYGRVIDLSGRHIDDALLLVMHQGRSYTGEDTVEIQCHGGSLVSRKVLEAALSAGARAARPGEFTFRAFLNGRLDLAQAEAVQELIAAKSEKALDAADSQLQGALSKKIGAFQERLTAIAAILEAWVDFPEEGLEFASVEEVCSDLEAIIQKMQKLIDTFHHGRVLREGISLCLVGAPNVGKSSLMNALLGKDRAIVSHEPGTTRDVIEDDLRLNGLNFRILDTAGIRKSDGLVEQEGVRRTEEAMASADLNVMVLDSSRAVNEREHKLLESLPKGKTVLAWNKVDLGRQAESPLECPYMATVSAKTGEGLEDLQEQIDACIWQQGPPSREEVVITNVRHKEALCHAVEAAMSVIDQLRSGASPEFVCMDIRCCLKELGKIIGTNVTEDILSSIFSTFCIGK